MSHGFGCFLLGAGLALGAAQWAKYETRGFADPGGIGVALILIYFGLRNIAKARRKK